MIVGLPNGRKFVPDSKRQVLKVSINEIESNQPRRILNEADEREYGPPCDSREYKG